MTYLGAGRPCRNVGPAELEMWPEATPEVDDGLGEFDFAAGVISLGKAILGGLSFGGVPLTKLGKGLSQLAKSRGVEQKAADQWAREWEKQRDGPCPGSGPATQTCRTNLVKGMVAQLSPGITQAEWHGLQAAGAAGGWYLDNWQVPPGGGGGIHLPPIGPPLPGGVGVPGGGLPGMPPVAASGMFGGPLGWLVIGLGAAIALPKLMGRRR